jgi:multicomponent Na+:H+ antiporter subunit D
MVAFMIGSLSIIGLPPFGGTWSKWYLAVGALEAGYQFFVAVLMISSLLNVAYLMPIVARAFFMAPDGKDGSAKAGIEEAPLPCVLALSFTALLCLLLFIFPDRIESLLRALVAVG